MIISCLSKLTHFLHSFCQTSPFYFSVLCIIHSASSNVFSIAAGCLVEQNVLTQTSPRSLYAFCRHPLWPPFGAVVLLFFIPLDLLLQMGGGEHRHAYTSTHTRAHTNARAHLCLKKSKRFHSPH